MVIWNEKPFALFSSRLKQYVWDVFALRFCVTLSFTKHFVSRGIAAKANSDLNFKLPQKRMEGKGRN